MKSWLFRDLSSKVISFFLAFLVWFYFFAAREGISLSFFVSGHSKAVQVPLKVLQPPLSLLQAEVSPDRVLVSLSGATNLLELISPLDINVYVDVANLGKGEYELPVRVEAPSGVKALSVTPNRVTVLLKSRVSIEEIDQVLNNTLKPIMNEK